ncbi:peptidoglycan DD-metalloendopeptidase family protein [Calidifontibacter terrae]
MTRGVAAGAVCLMFFSGTAHALVSDANNDKKTADAKVLKAQHDYDSTSAALATASANLTATNAKVTTATATLHTKEAALTTAQNHLKSVNSQLKIAQSSEGKSRRELSSIQTSEKNTTALVGGIARQSYMTGGLGKFDLTLQILIGQQDPSSTMSLADIVMRQQSGVLTSLSGQQASKKATISRLNAATTRVNTLSVQAKSAVTTATTARTDATTARNRLVALQKTQTEQKATLATQQTADLKTLTTEKTNQARIVGILKARAAARAKAAKKANMAMPAGGTPRALSSSGNGYFTPPMSPSSIVSEFGMRMNPVDHVMRLHAGVDFPYACGTPVRAAAAGDVVDVAFNDAAGNYVTIDHGFVHGTNLATMYEHLSRFVVRGGHVSKGQLIGYSGTTGRSTGCHLHWTVMQDGVPINPRNWIG